MPGVHTCDLPIRSEEHTSELQSHDNILCRLLLDKQNLGFLVGGAWGRCWAGVWPLRSASRGWPRLAGPSDWRSRARWVGRGRCGAYFFNDTATTEIYTLSLHDALPI